jgi:ubiquinone/menaquinone biosynthesis C-methylase UbiE
MSKTDKNKICSAENARVLDFKFRKIIQNPQKIIKPYVKEGMTVLDLGCGPGFFTIEMAKLVGSKGKVVAADLQEEMLEIVRKKAENTNLQNTIELHNCQTNKIGLTQEFDFILLFYMLHEVPNQSAFLKELHALLKPEGRILIVEPKIHVTKDDFHQSKKILTKYEFDIIKEPKVFFSRTVLIKKDISNEEFINSYFPTWFFSPIIWSNSLKTIPEVN